MRIRVLLILGLTLAMVSAAAGQGGQYRTRFSPPFAMGAITGLPYSAEQVSEAKQTLADGTHISQPTTTSRMFRDSAGRTRSERPITIGYPARQDSPSLVEIYDVVAGYRYILDPVNKVAHRSAIPPMPQRPGSVGGVIGSPAALSKGSPSAPAIQRPAAPATDSTPRPQTTSESLGTQVIEGLTCEGRKSTTTYPVGMIGNDRPLVSTNEFWMSVELRMMVLSKSSDPRSGDRTMQLKNISRAEQEYSLFQPPPDYKVVDETESFEIVIKFP